MSWRDPDWKYTPAEATKKPNYLREKFDAIRDQLAAEKRESEKKVKPIRKQETK